MLRIAVISAITTALVVLAGGAWILSMPGKSQRGPLPPLDVFGSEIAANLERHVRALAQGIGERNLENYPSLLRAQAYVTGTLSSLGHTVREQTFEVEGRICANLEMVIPGTTNTGEVVVVGAHYDSASGAPGANDNGSGTAALLELARLLRDARLERELRLVAFVNEEPPRAYSDAMGSVQYARRLRADNVAVTAMLSLETIGYYRDTPGSQRYPSQLHWFYPERGDFIGFVGNLQSRALVREAIGVFRATTAFPSEGIAGPERVPGIGWSDHWSFWRQGYPGIMVTDTALYRDPNYHTETDVADNLDYQRTARVVQGLVRVVTALATVE